VATKRANKSAPARDHWAHSILARTQRI
jgi:hypothetical protein